MATYQVRSVFKKGRTVTLTLVCGIQSPSLHDPPVKPKHPRRTDHQPYHCPRCDVTFTRRRSVWRHFVACIERNGNPDALTWVDHPSWNFELDTIKFPSQSNQPSTPAPLPQPVQQLQDGRSEETAFLLESGDEGEDVRPVKTLIVGNTTIIDLEDYELPPPKMPKTRGVTIVDLQNHGLPPPPHKKTKSKVASDRGRLYPEYRPSKVITLRVRGLGKTGADRLVSHENMEYKSAGQIMEDDLALEEWASDVHEQTRNQRELSSATQELVKEFKRAGVIHVDWDSEEEN